MSNIFGSFQELYTANAAFHPMLETPRKMPPPNRKLAWDFVMPQSEANPELDELKAEREQNIAEYKEYPRSYLEKVIDHLRAVTRQAFNEQDPVAYEVAGEQMAQVQEALKGK